MESLAYAMSVVLVGYDGFMVIHFSRTPPSRDCHETVTQGLTAVQHQIQSFLKIRRAERSDVDGHSLFGIFDTKCALGGLHD